MRPVSSSSSLFRQQRPQPSHKLSHSAGVISARLLRRQNGASGSGLGREVLSGMGPLTSSSTVFAGLSHRLDQPYPGSSAVSPPFAGRSPSRESFNQLILLA